MSEVVLAPQSAKQVWRRDAIREYVRESRFLPFTGPSPTASSSKASSKGMPIIQVLTDLEGKSGNVINVPLVTRLKGQGVSGSQVLVGNEDDLGNSNAQVATDWVRNGLVVPKSASYKTDLDLWNIGKSLLKDWFAEKLRDNLIQAMASIIIPGLPYTDPTTGITTTGADMAVQYANSTAAQRNAYLTANIDRILFGNSTANAVPGAWATSLANISTATGRASTATFNLAKRIAKKAGSGIGVTTPHIRPYMVPEMGREYFVAFVDSNTFRDIANDTAMINANRDARAREGDAMSRNPLFQDGDLEYQGVIYIEFPELNALTLIGAGAGPSNVSMGFLCGQQAMALAYTQMLQPHTDLKRDYEFRPGVAMDECRGQIKLSYNGVMLGIVPVFTSSVDDA